LAFNNGGDVTVYSPDTALFWADARIEATGGAESGDGGFVEVSGSKHVEVIGDVDASAGHGESGKLLLDPIDVTIQDSVGTMDPGENGGIATFSESDLDRTIPAEGNVRIPVVIEIPLNANVGDEYRVGAVFSVVSSSVDGSEIENEGVSFNFNIGKDFPVIVVGPEGINGDDRKYVEDVVDEDEIREAPGEDEDGRRRGGERGKGEGLLGGVGIWNLIVILFVIGILVVGFILFVSVRVRDSRYKI